MNYINALAFLLLKNKFQNGEYKEIIEISKEALKLINHPDLLDEIEELLKRSHDEWEIAELLKSCKKVNNVETDKLNKPGDVKRVDKIYENGISEEFLADKELKEEAKEVKKMQEISAAQAASALEEDKEQQDTNVFIPPAVKEEVSKISIEKTTDKTQATDKKSAYENMLKDVLKGLANDAFFNEANDLIITFNTQAWDGLPVNEQDEIINVLKYQVGKLKRDLSGSCVSGHVVLKGSEGQSLNTFYVQIISDGKNGSATVVF